MFIINATELHENLFNTLNDVIENNNPVTVNTRKGNAVILSEEDYKGMMETIDILSQKGLHQRIIEGEKEDVSEIKIGNGIIMWVKSFT